VAKDGGGVDAITGATITSRAVCDALRQGVEAYNSAGGSAGLAPEQPETTEGGKIVIPQDDVPVDNNLSMEPLAEPGLDEPSTESPDGEAQPSEEENAAGDEQQEEVADDGE